MSVPARRRSGEPVAALCMIALLWIVVRAFLWESPFPQVLEPLPTPMPQWHPATVAQQARAPHTPLLAPAGTVRPAAESAPAAMPVGPPPFAVFDPSALASRGEPVDAAGAHQLMWLFALTDHPVTVAAQEPPLAAWAGGIGQGAYPVPGAAAPAAAPAQPSASRWSLTGWVFLRRGGAALAAPGAVDAPTYGSSQAGAVLRYQLAPSSPARPTAYLRASAALHRGDDRELAGGLAVRPLPRVPVALMAEARLRESAGAVELRPAVMAVSELAPFGLPGGVQAESYFQAGYVGGPGATLFADGQIRATARVADVGRSRLRAGAGAWAGAQKGAGRLDFGPTAQVEMPLDRGNARLALDYRVRLAGDAAPGSGLALTLSAGF